MPIVRDLNVSGFIDVAIRDDCIFQNPIISASRIQKLESATNDDIVYKQDVTSWRSTNKTKPQEEDDDMSHFTTNSLKSCSRKSKFDDDEKSHYTTTSLNRNPQHNRYNISLVEHDEEDDEDSVNIDDDIASYHTKGTIKSLPQLHNVFVGNDDSDEIATLKDTLRSVQSEADWYKSKYKQLHLEFNDIQGYCEALSNEVIKVRNEKNEILLQQRSSNSNQPEHHNDHNDDASVSNSSSFSLTSSRLRKNWLFEKISSITNHNKNKWTEPKKFHEWDNETQTTQYTESNRTGASSFFGNSNTIPEQEQQQTDSFCSDTPKGIIISTTASTNTNGPTDNNNITNGVRLEVPYEVPASEQSVSELPIYGAHRCKPRRASIMMNRRDSMSSVVNTNELRELNLNDDSQIFYQLTIPTPVITDSPTSSVAESHNDGEDSTSVENDGFEDFEVGLNEEPKKPSQPLLVDWNHASSSDDESGDDGAFLYDVSYGSTRTLSMEMPQDLSAFNVDR